MFKSQYVIQMKSTFWIHPNGKTKLDIGLENIASMAAMEMLLQALAGIIRMTTTKDSSQETSKETNIDNVTSLCILPKLLRYVQRIVLPREVGLVAPMET